jgi:cob(I)alamin adenosyltransferase
MTHFVLPGGHTTVSYCHIALRLPSRRAIAVHLSHNELVAEIAIYLNRLSDYLCIGTKVVSHDER